MITTQLYSSLEKIFPDGRYAENAAPYLTALRGESIAFQVKVSTDGSALALFPKLECGLPMTLRRVESVPVRQHRPPEGYDRYYISPEPGMYPDTLIPLTGNGGIAVTDTMPVTLLIEAEIPQDAAPGEYPVTLRLYAEDGTLENELSTAVTVLEAVLPAQTLRHTEWFHADCLADYYGVEALSEEHWQIVEAFVRTAVKRGQTMLLTPHVTPALDTMIGGERTTVQLVDVTDENGVYSFNFDKLGRWFDMGLRCGMKEFEMAHLFTQWGAAAAPKVMVRQDGVLSRRFGWDTPSVGGEYTRFLHAYLPALTAYIKERGLQDSVVFHISDEPGPAQLESYRAARESLGDLLNGFSIMDAMSHYEVYEGGNITFPVVSIRTIDDFIARQTPGLWAYYCCGPVTEKTNRFLQMPLHRTRALGIQLWKYGIGGFLHWGYNFYNSFRSVTHVNPYTETEGMGVFPGGDPFIVYPGADGKPLESLRILALHGAMQDYRALQALEAKIGREKTAELLDADGAITWNDYPHTAQAFQQLRARINDALK